MSILANPNLTSPDSLIQENREDWTKILLAILYNPLSAAPLNGCGHKSLVENDTGTRGRGDAEKFSDIAVAKAIRTLAKY